MEILQLSEKFEAGLTYEKFLEGAGIHRSRYLKSYAAAEVTDCDREFFSSLGTCFILVLAEVWCADVSAILPVVIQAIEGLEKVRLRICLRSAHEDLMEHYLTDGKAAMPKFIFLDERYSPKADWGPRPRMAQQIMEDNRSKLKWGLPWKFLLFRKIDRFYKQDRGGEILKEIRQLLGERR